MIRRWESSVVPSSTSGKARHSGVARQAALMSPAAISFTRLIDGATKRKLCDFVSVFGLYRRSIFGGCRWEGGPGGEHYDLFLQLARTKWRVAHEPAVAINHHPDTPSLPGYHARRQAVIDPQIWLMRKWGLKRIWKDGELLFEDPVLHNPARPGRRLNAGGKQNALVPAAASAANNGPHRSAQSVEESSLFAVCQLIPTNAHQILLVGNDFRGHPELSTERHDVDLVRLDLQGLIDELLIALDASRQQVNGWLTRRKFDCIILADVLSAVSHPERLVRRLRSWLREGGSITARIANARYHRSVSGLLNGSWSLDPESPVDSLLHPREIEKLFFRGGFGCEFHADASSSIDFMASQRSAQASFDGFTIAGLAPSEMAEFSTEYFLVRAHMRGLADYGFTSIVVVTHNELTFTKRCLQSIAQFTDEPYEIIVVDNGSTDGTPDYIHAVANATLLRNDTNAGFPAAANQGNPRQPWTSNSALEQ